ASACAIGDVSLDATLPANTTAKPKSYKFTLAARGAKTAKATTTVFVAPQPPPTVTSFAATPNSLPQPGGAVQLTASVADAVSCVFSSTPTVAGLPATVPCASGEASISITLPPDPTTKPQNYKFALSVTGSKTTKADPVQVKVSGTLAAVSSFDATPENLSA